MLYYLAIDIGASSGRHVVGWHQGDDLVTQEVHRFPNGIRYVDGHLVWDIEDLLENVKAGIDKALHKFPEISGLAIDAWGVDYVLMDGERELLPVYAYRDERTLETVAPVHEIIPFSDLYKRTGCQFQPFNTIYQLYDDLKKGRLEQATHMLMIPEYLLYKLCGAKIREYTNATTTGLVNGATGAFDEIILNKLGYPKSLFPKLTQPGTVVGDYRGIPCVLCCTHDTASAVEGIPMQEDTPYISSGTWSLLGVKVPHSITDENSRLANFSNEGGKGYIRYQKNIMGMWIVNELKKQLCPDADFSQIIKMAQESKCDCLVDVNSPQFLSPDSMKAAFDYAADRALDSTGDYFRCAFRSLANSYHQALTELEQNTGKIYDKLYIVGGGAKNEYLNQLTQMFTGKEVIALPIEATALGNLRVQMEGR